MLPSYIVGLLAASYLCGGNAQSSFPHDYPGRPTGDFGPEWQKYYEVTQPLPNVTFGLGRSFAGNIPVNRASHPNNTLFFWAFEKEGGSLTAAAGERSGEPWGIWLNGGPGSSSMIGLMRENGPFLIAGDSSLVPNNYSWNRLADFIWVDQPAGTGFSTLDLDGEVVNQDQMAEDFFGFLSNLVKVFPSLRSRPFFLTGESYAGVYIPYITKQYFGLADPPVNLRKIAIGNGSIGNRTVYREMTVMQIIETFPQLIAYDTEVFNYFKGQSQLCGYDLKLAYPQNAKFPTPDPPQPTGSSPLGSRDTLQSLSKSALLAESYKNLVDIYKIDPTKSPLGLDRRELEAKREPIAQKREEWKNEKRQLTTKATTLDPIWGCFLVEELEDYATRIALPWSLTDGFGFDPYNIPNGLSPQAPVTVEFFMNDNAVRGALHAPTDGDFLDSNPSVLGGQRGMKNPSVAPMAFLDELAVNATQRGVGIVIYSGNDDLIVAHHGSEVVIQNTTFGGTQGFTRKPSTPWYGDDGEFAGIVHQERNWTYVLFANAGHLVPRERPDHAFVFMREFVLGNNQTGLVTNMDGKVDVVGGESTTLYANNILPGQDGIHVGSGRTESTFFYPSATVAAWRGYTATASPPAITKQSSSTVRGVAVGDYTSRVGWLVIFVMFFVVGFV